MDQEETPLTPLLPDQGSKSEDEQAVNVPPERDESPLNNWTMLHTITVLIIRMIIDFAFKNPFFFYANYEQGLGLDYFQFAAILIASEVGAMNAVLLRASNWITMSDQTLMTASLIVCGVATFCFPGLSILYGNDSTLATVIYCCVCRFFVGISFSFASAASIKIASDYVESPEYVTQIISVLHYSWPLANSLNVASGYIMEEQSWEYVFLITGVVLVIVAILSMIIFRRFSLPPVSEDTEHDSGDISPGEGLAILFTDWRSVIIILTSFAMTYRSRSIYIITASYWMEDTYGLTASQVGLSTLSTVLGEVIGLSVMGVISHRFALKMSAAGTLTHQLVVNALLFIFSAIYGNNLTLGGALVFIVFLTMGHESFYVVQQSNAIKFAPGNLKFMLLLAERMAQEIGSVLALLISVMIWDDTGSQSILCYSLIWLGGVLLESFVLLIYKDDASTTVSVDR